MDAISQKSAQLADFLSTRAALVALAGGDRTISQAASIVLRQPQGRRLGLRIKPKLCLAALEQAQHGLPFGLKALCRRSLSKITIIRAFSQYIVIENPV